MTTVQKHSKMVITVLLANHADREHTYDFKPGDTMESARAIVIKVFANMAGILLDNEKHIVLTHTSYRLEHIVGFQVTAQGQEEIAQQIEQQSRTLGFTA